MTNVELGLQVRTIKNNDGSILVNAEDTAKGFGWIKTELKGTKKYTSIRWETLNNYCKEFGFANLLSKDDYIPESLFYLLGMKANNKVAQEFQKWLAIDVIPQIRQTGGYIPVQEGESEADILAKALMIAQKRIELKDRELAIKENKILEDAPKVKYYHTVLASDNTHCITSIAKELGTSGIVLNRLLHEHRIQYKLGGRWVLYSQYQDQGFMTTKTTIGRNGQVYTESKWTEKGREAIIEWYNNVIKANNFQ